MAGLVLIATAGASTANTYCTLAEAEVFVLEFVNITGWTGATDAAKNAALVQATHDIDCLPLLGTPEGTVDDEEASDYQPLHFPTVDDFDDTDTGYIPANVKRATVLQAIYLLRSNTAKIATEDLITSGITGQSIGRMSQQYSKHSAAVVCEQARRYLSRWISSRRLEFA
jgi:hypothetical protein